MNFALASLLLAGVNFALASLLLAGVNFALASLLLAGVNFALASLLLADASFAAAAGAATLRVEFEVDFEVELLLIKDFFVIAIVVSPKIWIQTALRLTILQAACQTVSFL
jgi:hypothetical protein